MAHVQADRLTPGNAKMMVTGDILQDHEVKGLSLRCGAKSRSFMLYYRTRLGVERRPRIGAWPDMNIDTARKVARALLERVARGEDPSAEWGELRALPTVAELWPQYLEWIKKNREPGTVAEYARQYNVLVAPHSLAKMTVRAVTLKEVEAWLDDVRNRRMQTVKLRKDGTPIKHTPARKEAPKAANRALALLSGMFKFAELYTGTPPWRDRDTNPCKGATVAPAGKRDRYATADELPRIGAALDALWPVYPEHVTLLRLHLLTGARTGELAPRLWAELDTAKRAFVLTKHKTARRTGVKELLVPPAALAELRRLSARGIAHPSGRIFPHIADDNPLRFLWERVREMAGCPDLQIRDLRRTYASLIFDPSAGEAVNSRLIGGLLGHTNEKTTTIYTHLFSHVKQKTAETAANRAAGLLGVSNNDDEKDGSGHGD